MNDAPALLEVENVHVHYADGVHALRGVSLALGQGERVGLVGPNGEARPP